MPRETKGYSEQELFEDNVKKLVKRFSGKENELRELREEKQAIADDPSHTEEREHTLYEIRTFDAALQRIEAEKEVEK